MRQARRHHYISQFYLRNFVAARAAPQVFVVDLPTQKSFTTSTENVALENDFHTISIEGQEPDAVEKALAKFEGEVAPALTRIIDSASLENREDAGLVLYFATLLLVKAPTGRSRIDDFVNELMSKIGEFDASDPKAWEAKIRRNIQEGVMSEDVDIGELRQLILGHAFTVGLSTEAHLALEFENARPLFEQFVATRRWNVYSATAGQFVTCDRPVVLMWSDPMKTEPIGLALPNTRVLFALSSRIAILGGFELEDAVIEVGAEEVAKINGQIILNANRQVYARDSTFEYALLHNSGAKRGNDLPNDELAKWKQQ